MQPKSVHLSSELPSAPRSQDGAETASIGHSPLPWRIGGYCARPPGDKPKGSRIVADRGDGFEFHIAVVGTHPGINAEQARANATLIVDTVNNLASNRQELIAAYERLARLEADLHEVREYLEEDMGVVDGDDGQYAPNRAMQLVNLIDETLNGPGAF